MEKNRGFIQVYTGNGKGKTTAAIGLAVRAVGAKKKVFIAQFVKGMVYSEIEVLRQLTPAIKVNLYGKDCFISREPSEEDIQAAKNGLKEVSEIIHSEQYDVIILDEATIAVNFNLFSIDDLIAVLRLKPIQTEIIITGRYAPPELLELADLVTDMTEVKHYYTSGVLSRKGIEF